MVMISHVHIETSKIRYLRDEVNFMTPSTTNNCTPTQVPNFEYPRKDRLIRCRDLNSLHRGHCAVGTASPPTAVHLPFMSYRAPQRHRRPNP